MPNIKLTKERLELFRVLRACTPPISYSAIGRLFKMDHSTISRALNSRNKMEYPGSADRILVAQQIREIADKIESGEISIK